MFTNTKDRVAVATAVVVAGAGLIVGSLSGAWNVQHPTAGESTAPVSVTADTAQVHSLHPCSDYADGSPVPSGIDGACTLDTTSGGYALLDTADYGTDIPRCASDDSNTDHVPRCYTERTTDNAVILVNQDDTTLATLVG